MARDKIKVLVVDDTLLYRKVLRDVLSSFSETEVVGTASNGKAALEKIEELSPDLVTLDVEMPVMDGLETLSALKEAKKDVKVIMVSALTKKDAQVTMRALQLGAFDFIAKPDGGSLNENVESLKLQFAPKIRVLKPRLQGRARAGKEEKEEAMPGRTSSPAPAPPPVRGRRTPPSRPSIVAVGVSTGGPKALTEVIPRLPADLPVPVAVVQHMPPVFTGALAENLDKKSALAVVEAEDGTPLEAGRVYIAPGGKQMRIGGSSTSPVVRVTDDPPENHCKPSVDYLFRSVREVFGPKALGVIMTGMGRDGTEGLKEMKKSGAFVLAQDEATCVVYGMPMEAVKAGVVDEILPLEKLAERITALVGSAAAAGR